MSFRRVLRKLDGFGRAPPHSIRFLWYGGCKRPTLPSRAAGLDVCEKVSQTGLYICFPDDGEWFLYPHDAFLRTFLASKKISKRFWAEKTEWSPQRTLELANKAYSLYLTRNPQEQAQLLRIVLLNCAIDVATVHPTYRKPFDLIFSRAKNEEWSGREDLNLRPPGPELKDPTRKE